MHHRLLHTLLMSIMQEWERTSMAVARVSLSTLILTYLRSSCMTSRRVRQCSTNIRISLTRQMIHRQFQAPPNFHHPNQCLTKSTTRWKMHWMAISLVTLAPEATECKLHLPTNQEERSCQSEHYSLTIKHTLDPIQLWLDLKEQICSFQVAV